MADGKHKVRSPITTDVLRVGHEEQAFCCASPPRGRGVPRPGAGAGGRKVSLPGVAKVSLCDEIYLHPSASAHVPFKQSF